MPELVTVSSVERMDDLKNRINEYVERGRYDEITQAVGMHSILSDPEHMIADQDHLYHLVLNLLKNKVTREDPKTYASWVVAFPALLAKIITEGRIITDRAAQDVLASRHAAFGPFSSLDEFWFWALDDRRLPLQQMMRYIRATIELHRK
jgi:hypothetical protein